MVLSPPPPARLIAAKPRVSAVEGEETELPASQILPTGSPPPGTVEKPRDLHKEVQAAFKCGAEGLSSPQIQTLTISSVQFWQVW